MDYARSAHISHLLRDYCTRRNPDWSLDYPLNMLFALVFYNGAWHVASSGDMRGRHVFKKAKVSNGVVAKRIKHGMMDMEGVVSALEKAGLYTHVESVKIQTYFLRFFKGAMDDYLVVRVGAPLYRLQQEAERLRHQTKRSDSDRTEEYYLNHDFYPETGFDEFTTSEKFKMCLNIIQGKSEEGTVSAGGAGGRSGRLRGDISGPLREVPGPAQLHRPARSALPARAVQGLEAWRLHVGRLHEEPAAGVLFRLQE